MGRSVPVKSTWGKRYEIDALQSWQQLADEYGEVAGYYSHKYSHLSTDNKRKKEMLEQGAADFDQKYCPDDEHEKAHYRTDYDVSHEGYMDMHLKQNLAALRHCFTRGTRKPLLFVDFGCGPMTAGLALAEGLSGQTANYKKQTAYFGVDASRKMVRKAKRINAKHNLFSPKRFCGCAEHAVSFTTDSVFFFQGAHCGFLPFVCVGTGYISIRLVRHRTTGQRMENAHGESVEIQRDEDYVSQSRSTLVFTLIGTH